MKHRCTNRRIVSVICCTVLMCAALLFASETPTDAHTRHWCQSYTKYDSMYDWRTVPRYRYQRVWYDRSTDTSVYETWQRNAHYHLGVFQHYSDSLCGEFDRAGDHRR